MKLVKGLKELRFIFCQYSERSNGVRQFLGENYLKIKEVNPEFPFIIRECEGADPYIIARYSYGIEKKALIDNLTNQEVQKVIQDLINQTNVVNNQIQGQQFSN